MHLKPSLAAVAIFGCGFALAWLVKPAPMVGRVETALPRTREDRSDRPPLATKPAAAALQRLQGSSKEELEAALANDLREIRCNSKQYSRWTDLGNPETREVSTSDVQVVHFIVSLQRAAHILSSRGIFFLLLGTKMLR